MIAPSHPIIFTDLDGTLLELESYTITTAAPTVQRLTAQGIPVIFCSSKTAQEQLVYREALHLHTPFIVENGAAIFIPEGYFDFKFPYQKIATYQAQRFQVIELALEVRQIRAMLADIRAQCALNVAGYVDLTLAEISDLTGLDSEAAQRACQREYSETILKWYLSPNYFSVEAMQATLSQQLGLRGCQGVAGSKFYTISGAGSDKGQAVQHLTELFRRQYGDIVTVGLGDGLNDAPMLAVVDYPYLVQKPHGQWAEVNLPHLTRVAAIGPRGWCEVMGDLVIR